MKREKLQNSSQKKCFFMKLCENIYYLNAEMGGHFFENCELSENADICCLIFVIKLVLVGFWGHHLPVFF